MAGFNAASWADWLTQMGPWYWLRVIPAGVTSVRLQDPYGNLMWLGYGDRTGGGYILVFALLVITATVGIWALRKIIALGNKS